MRHHRSRTLHWSRRPTASALAPAFGRGSLLALGGLKELRAYQTFGFSQHNIMNPRIDIHGERATGVWYIMGPWTNTEDGKEIWMTARYDDDYVKVNGEWKYKHLRGSVWMVADR